MNRLTLTGLNKNPKYFDIKEKKVLTWELEKWIRDKKDTVFVCYQVCENGKIYKLFIAKIADDIVVEECESIKEYNILNYHIIEFKTMDEALIYCLRLNV